MVALERIDQALVWARAALARASDSGTLDAAVLLAHVLGTDRTALIAHPERPLSTEQAETYRTLVMRGAAGEPLPYLTGTRAFYGRDLIVTPAVLIPRPETEHLVESALAWVQGRAGLRIADIGTGSGAIAVTLAAHLPDAQVWAADVSPEALAVARQNAARYNLLDRIVFAPGDLLEPLRESGPFDLIAANLPYIPCAELDTLAVARHEPRLALDGGADGLDLIRRLLAEVPGVLAAHGLLLLEIGAGQGAQVAGLTRETFPGAQVRVIPDYAGHERVVRIERGG